MSEEDPKPTTVEEITAEQMEAQLREAMERGERRKFARPRTLEPRFKVEQTNMREVVFDCPWTGHLVSDEMVSLRKDIPFVGRLCVKCGAMVYQRIAMSKVLGADGKPLVAPGMVKQ